MVLHLRSRQHRTRSMITGVHGRRPDNVVHDARLRRHEYLTIRAVGLVAGLGLILLASCQGAKPPRLGHTSTMGPTADIVAVHATGDSGAYRFEVTVRSPDEGCEQYADWWEILYPDGRLLYRRVVSHSHVDEQPFTRSGGPVPAEAGAIVWVRAHMHPAGYGGSAFRGSVEQGFETANLPATFAADVANHAPLPPACRF